MKKILNSLPFKLLLGVIVGILLGLVANEAVMNVVVTIKQVLGQIITFCVPLIVLGFIAPSITRLGKNASLMLGVAVVLAPRQPLEAPGGWRVFLRSFPSEGSAVSCFMPGSGLLPYTCAPLLQRSPWTPYLHLVS